MKPYGKYPLKGISGCRKSHDTPHRRRCLRVDKKSVRFLARKEDNEIRTEEASGTVSDS